MKLFVKKYYFLLLPFGVTLFMLLQGMSFIQVDDLFMMEMANSFKSNSHSEHLMFINICFGYLLKFLYGIFPGMNWFFVLYFVITNLAFIPLYKISQNYEYKLIFSGIIAAVQIAVFSFLTFTVLAFLCATAGVLWGLEYIRKIDKKCIKHLLFSFFLICLGFGMRAGNTFVCIILIFLPIYYFAILQKRNSIGAVALLIIITIIANYGMLFIQKEYKKTIPEDTYFRQFHEYRAIISDDLKLDYNENKDVYDSLGISENDLILYSYRMYADKNVFSRETLKEIIDAQDFSNKYTFNILEFEFDSFVILATLAYIFTGTIFFALFKKRRKEILVFSLFILAAILFLHIRRRAPFRVVFPIVASGLLTLVYIVIQETKKEFALKLCQKRIAYISICALILMLSGYNVLKISKLQNLEIQSQKVIEHINCDKSKIYVTDDFGEWKYSSRIAKFGLNNDKKRPVCIFGDWYVYSYFWYDRLENLNLSRYSDSPYLALLDDNVRMIYGKDTATLDKMCLFLKEHYGIQAAYQIDETINETEDCVYKFYEVK